MVRVLILYLTRNSCVLSVKCE